ncbi:hypothetical protein MPSEU_000394100 [Mayamaea pseudoterrestris]|nr:hypothetical protein MPSEU_000394100 [Mayamaea pseudoterrestris]
MKSNKQQQHRGDEQPQQPDAAPPSSTKHHHRSPQQKSSWTPSLKKVLLRGHERCQSSGSATNTTAGLSVSPASSIVSAHAATGLRQSSLSGSLAASPQHGHYTNSSSQQHQQSYSLGKLAEHDNDDHVPPPPIDATPPSPKTPPKLWERQYRNFLQSSKPPKRSVQRSASRDELDESSSMNNGVTSGARSLLLQQQHRSSSFHHHHDTPPVEEASVRGGQFFASVFKSHSHHKRTSKSKSHNELDGTMRRGSEKGLAQMQLQQPPPLALSMQHHHHVSNVDEDKANYSNLSASSLPNFQMIANRQQQLLLPRRQQSAGSATTAGASLLLNTLHSPSEATLALNSFNARDETSTNNNNDATAASAMKRAFTEFHNVTGRDAASAFLGDDPSHRDGMRGGSFVVNNSNHHGNVSHLQSALASTCLSSSHGRVILPPKSLNAIYGPRSVPLATDGCGSNVAGTSVDYATQQQQQQRIYSGNHTLRRILKPLVPVESWQSGRRYVIAPSVWAACPMGVMAALTRNSVVRSARDVTSAPFGTILLGQCLLRSMSTDGAAKNVLLDDEPWTPALLVLRQNYLLEYGTSDPLGGMPRGYAHLQHATCCDNTDTGDTETRRILELDFYGSPCAKSDRRRLLIRPGEPADFQHWIQCLNAAGSLQVSDLYEYDADNPLGTGSYASVFAARRKCSGSSEACAVKVFDKTLFWRCVIKGRERADTIVREVSVQATLTARCSDVQSFLRIRGVFETTDHVVIESELLDGMDLFRYISSRPRLSETEAAFVIYNILICLQAMNRIGLSHRDIKPANILVCHEENRPLTVKVADFGLATFVGVDGKVSGRCGTPGFAAPEIFNTGVHGTYTKKVDVFSAGVTLYVMLCGYEPFYGETDSELIRANREAHIEFPPEEWKCISSPARELVIKMMHADPSKRMSIEQAITHPWIIENVHEQGDVPALAEVTEMPSYDACIIS